MSDLRDLMELVTLAGLTILGVKARTDSLADKLAALRLSLDDLASRHAALAKEVRTGKRDEP